MHFSPCLRCVCEKDAFERNIEARWRAAKNVCETGTIRANTIRKVKYELRDEYTKQRSAIKTEIIYYGLWVKLRHVSLCSYLLHSISRLMPDIHHGQK